MSRQPVEIFISYSRKDARYLAELCKHLKVYEREELVRVWHDGNLQPGVEWEPEIFERFTGAQIILLLISSDFFNSDYCSKREMPEALKLHEERKARVVPIIIRHVAWSDTKLARLMVLPQNGLPIKSWTDKDAAYVNVVGRLREILDEINGVDPADESLGPWSGQSPDEAARPPVIAAVDPAPPPVVPAPESKSGELPRPDPHSPTPTDRPSGIPSAADRFIVPEVVVCFQHKERRDTLLSLRRWCMNPENPLFVGRAARVVESQTLEEAVDRMRERSGGTILLLDGFLPNSPEVEELIHSDDGVPAFEMIVNPPDWEPIAAQRPTASILQPVHTVTCDAMLLETLRKSLLRVRTRQLASVRVLKSKTELAEFFALRYRVWTELKYLPADQTCPKTPWEVDFTDRTSLPMGIFSKADGKLLGAARLVRGFGDENAALVKMIEELLRDRDSPILQERFRNPGAVMHPFDILGEMTRFQEYYCGLVRSGVSKAEVSRVIVAPDWTRGGLGEVIVDTLCSLARAHSISTVFLACHENHSAFYGRCGFQKIPSVTGTRFLTYNVPCIAMQRQLDCADLVEEAVC